MRSLGNLGSSLPLEGGNDGNTANETKGSQGTEDCKGTLVDAKETEMVNDAREDQLGGDENSSGSSSAEGGDGENGDGDIDGAEDTTCPSPDGSFREHDS